MTPPQVQPSATTVRRTQGNPLTSFCMIKGMRKETDEHPNGRDV